MDRLRDYIELNLNKPFDWASHNCLSFVAGYHQDIIKAKWYSGFDSPKGAIKLYKNLRRNSPYQDILEAFDNIFYPQETLHPRDGFIVFRASDGDVIGGSFGLVYHNACVFVGESSLEFTKPQLTDIYWKSR